MNIVVNLNKDRGITSQDAVTAVKKVFKVKKAGHTGTLDPLATGVMLVCLNEATKIASFIEALEKEYIATAKLGETTDTLDSEGTIIRKVEDFNITGDDIKRVLPHFTGEIEQVPPMYSALKVSGKPLYKLARKGIEVERKARKVNVSSIEVIGFDIPFFTLKIVCSKGTYIRSLCSDIGDVVGAGAHMVELTRMRVGNFRIGDAAWIGELPQKASALHSIDSVLQHLPELTVAGEDLRKARNGNALPLLSLPDPLKTAGTVIRLKDDSGRIFGIGKVAKDSIKIERLLFL
ncbi:MAG TPA: tRNA pseudouridine(55) synthase TruB [Dissulfurispiraceae bacterium]|nr:tRNA pseudouridine(55) synthase TruB [Dissulfurispiraceae bacterium]